MDIGLERVNAKDYKEAARVFYGVYRSLPDSDTRRDLASYHLAGALVELGLMEAGAEHYMEVVAGRRLPEFMDKALSRLKVLYEKHFVDEERFVEGTIYNNQYSELSPDVGDFVEYLQALADIRHGFEDWGRKRLVALAHGDRPYTFYARYALAADRLGRKEDDAAAKDLREIVGAGNAPIDARDRARLALARILYEKKAYEDAWRIYSQIDAALPLQDLVMLEKAWDRTASGDEQRALGLILGLGAPVFVNIFAPERDLIRGMALRRLCQFRAVHGAVREFRATYGGMLQKIRDRTPVRDDPAMRKWALAATRPLAEQGHLRAVLVRERTSLGSIADKPLHDHLDKIYLADIGHVDAIISRGLDRAIDRVSDELLRVDEQMNLIDYEIGAGLFKSGDTKGVTRGARPGDIPYATSAAYFKFDGEYWTDEVSDYTVLADDRCMR
jgi:hypothetical protein